jgi:hypothetical protein
MKKLIDQFKHDKKHYTQNRGEGKTIVLSGYRWVYSMSISLTSDLKGNKCDFFSALKNQDFFIEDVHWGGYNQESRILRFHGPYPIEEISHESYVLVNLDKSVELLKLTMDNADFNYGSPFDQEYKNEAIDLLKNSLTDKNEIYWLNKKFGPERIDYWGRYGFWAEFVARNENELVYITIGED